jgi:hypothetical protein
VSRGPSRSTFPVRDGDGGRAFGRSVARSVLERTRRGRRGGVRWVALVAISGCHGSYSASVFRLPGTRPEESCVSRACERQLVEVAWLMDAADGFPVNAHSSKIHDRSLDVQATSVITTPRSGLASRVPRHGSSTTSGSQRSLPVPPTDFLSRDQLMRSPGCFFFHMALAPIGSIADRRRRVQIYTSSGLAR